MTKREAEQEFRNTVLPLVVEHYEADGIRDKPARSEAWNDWTDGLCKDGQITEWQYENWQHPRWL